MATQDEIISSFEFVFTVVFGIGLLTTTQYVVNQNPQSGLFLMFCAGLLTLLAKAVRHKKGIVKTEG
jgi:hypothetical protein